nr:NAD(P)H-binding protein [Halorhodospira abdelmalekii]
MLFGASRGLGFEIARQLYVRNQRIVALVRPTTDSALLEQLGVEVVRGDATSADDVSSAFAHAGNGATVLSTLSGRDEQGHFVDEIANALITDIARHSTTERFLLVTAIGCGEMRPFRSERAIAAFGDVVDAKSRAEAYLRGSGVPYTLIRPGGLTNKPATGGGMLTSNWLVHGSISRADAAEQIVSALDSPRTIDRAFALVDEELAYFEGAERTVVAGSAP